MAYVNLDSDYFDHPKVARLRSLLGRDADVLPVRLICFCAKYFAATGALSGLSLEEIESRIGWRGESGKAVKALVESGILDAEEGGYRVHGWKEHQGHIQALRVRASNAAKERWKKMRSNAQALLKQSPSRTSLPSKPKSLEGKAQGSSEVSAAKPPDARPQGRSPAANPVAQRMQDSEEAAKEKKLLSDLTYSDGIVRSYMGRTQALLKDDLEMDRVRAMVQLLKRHGRGVPKDVEDVVTAKIPF